jgi:hypothetical protein
MLTFVFREKDNQTTTCVNASEKNVGSRFVPRRPANQTLRIKIATIFVHQEEAVTTEIADIFIITPLVIKRFAHLPQPIFVTYEGDEVVIQYRVDTAS